MEVKPDAKKIKIYYLWSLFPLALGSIMLFIDAGDGFIYFTTIVSCFMFAVASFILCSAVYKHLSFSLVVAPGFVYKENKSLVVRINWEDVDNIYFLVYSTGFWMFKFNTPYLCFISKTADKALSYNMSSLSADDMDKLLIYLKDFADQNSISVNYTIESTIIPK